jgi:hypothetical protein
MIIVGLGLALPLHARSDQAPQVATIDDVAVASGTAEPYLVDHRAIVRGTVPSPLAKGSFVYPLVRREGGAWLVEPRAVIQPGGRDWVAELEFGTQSERASRFELQIVETHSPLPLGPVPVDVLSRSVKSSTRILRVTRKVSDPVVWIASIDGHVVMDATGETLNVGYEAAIEVNAVDVPFRSQKGRARVGIAVQPFEASEYHWVMPESLDAFPGIVTGHFGVKHLHNFQRFRVIAFSAWDWPPVGVQISSADWRRISQAFLAMSKPVDVWLWYGETRISHVDNVATAPLATIVADRQADVRGTLRRPLITSGGAPERVWLVCVPREGDPWVAGWTRVLQNGGRWVIGSAQLAADRKPALFDAVVVVSAEDLTKMKSASLRAFLHDAQERSTERVRVRIGRRMGKGGRR